MKKGRKNDSFVLTYKLFNANLYSRGRNAIDIVAETSLIACALFVPNIHARVTESNDKK